MTASLENCKRLYELSGWDSDDELHYLGGEIHYKRLFESDMHHLNTTKDTYAPAYSAGYLLRKLPKWGKYTTGHGEVQPNSTHLTLTVTDDERT